MFTSDIFGAKISVFKQNFQGFILNKRKNLCILFSLILAFFFVGCSDFYQDMSGSSIEMSFKVPEKIDERVIVSRNTSITDNVTYKLVVKLESKNEVLDKIEKKVCSGELVNLAFTNVKKGKTVKVSVQLLQEEECVYIGESDWINTSKGKNYVKVMLDTTEEPIVPSIAAQPTGEIVLYSENTENLHEFSLYCASVIVDTSNYEQNLSMQWQEKTNSGWTDIDASRFEDNEITYVTYIDVTLQKNEVRTFRCVISNYIITPAGKKKTVTLYSNEATIAYIEGELDSISADYIGEYELYGDEVQKENFKVFANYKVLDSIQSLPVNDFNVKNENSSCIGNVPHSITYPTTAPTGISTTIPVPVKYQLNADKLAITALVDGIENIQKTDSGTRLKIAQYTQNVQLSANYNDTVYLYNGETYNPSPINILDICNINWASYSGGPSIGSTNTLTIQDESNALSQGLATYECTITPNTNSEFIVGESVTKQYFVNVCPWEIKLQLQGTQNPDGFDNKTLEGGVTYFPKLTNEAIVDGTSPSDVIYTVDEEDFSIAAETNVIQAPNASTNEQKATIKASWNGKEIASLEVVVPAKENSGTTGGGSELIGEEVSSFDELKSALADQNLTTILIVQDINVTECLNIERSVTIAANSDVRLVNQVENDYMFWLLGAELTLGGGTGCLTIQGSTYSTIACTSAENVININDNVKFSELNSYAISITNQKNTVNIYGGVFENNYSVPINVGAGTLIIDGGTLYTYNGNLIKYSKETTIVILGTTLDTSSGGYYSKNIINGQIVN